MSPFSQALAKAAYEGPESGHDETVSRAADLLSQALGPKPDAANAPEGELVVDLDALDRMIAWVMLYREPL